MDATSRRRGGGGGWRRRGPRRQSRDKSVQSGLLLIIRGLSRGLAYEDATFATDDGVRLSGWYLG
jgi:hypothetical protein